jgi:hypothetical protein
MRILWRVLVVIVLIAAILGIGVYAYNVGIAQGLAQKVQVQAAPSVKMPMMYYGHPFPGFGFGFGLLGCLIPLFLLFLVFGSLRFLFWRGSMGWGRMHHRRWNWQDENGKDVPPFFAEWHRRAHASPDQEKKD